MMPLDRLLGEIWATHQIFRTAGFTPDEIVVVPDSVHPITGHHSQAVAVLRGAETFAITMPHHKFSEQAVLTAWTVYCARMNEATDLERKRTYEGSLAHTQFVPILHAMKAKGGQIGKQVSAFMDAPRLPHSGVWH